MAAPAKCKLQHNLQQARAVSRRPAFGRKIGIAGQYHL
jgi:hypothetical protein